LEFISGKSLAEKLPNLLLVVGFATAVFGYIQYFFFPDLSILADYGWDPHAYRLAGTFLDTGFMGVLLVLFSVLPLVRMWGGQAFVLLTPLLLILVVALALTYSRASYLAYFAAIAVLYIVRHNFRWLLLTAFALLLIVPFLPRPFGKGVRLERTSTLAYRVNNYKHALEVIRESPVFGVGYNLYKFTRGDAKSHGASGVDSSLLLVFATTGVAGAFVYLQLMWRVLALAWERKKSTLGLFLLVSLVVVGVHSLFDNSLFYPWVIGWLLILLAAQS